MISAKTILHLITCIDLTCLDDQADEKQIIALCDAAIQAPHKVASICIAPTWVPAAKAHLANHAIPITTVINFPKPNLDQKQISQAIQSAIALGADEIDIVFPYVQFNPNNNAPTMAWLQAARQACDDHILKVIIETGQAPSNNWIEAATHCVAEAGANFVKTSTGKGFPGATIEAVQCMAYALHESNTPCGLKISGGIRTVAQVMAYCDAIKAILGETFMRPEWLRFGASQLLDDCLKQLAQPS